jgi:hypothetical protein
MEVHICLYVRIGNDKKCKHSIDKNPGPGQYLIPYP